MANMKREINQMLAGTPPERQLQQELISKLRDPKYGYRADIHNHAALGKNFRQKFQARNHVTLALKG